MSSFCNSARIGFALFDLFDMVEPTTSKPCIMMRHVADAMPNREASGYGGSHVGDGAQLKWEGRDSSSESGVNHATASSDTEDWEKPENVGSILMTRQRRDEEYASWGAASASSFPLPAVPMIQQHESKASAASAASAASVASTSSASAASAASADKQVGKSVAAKTIPPEIAHAMVGVCR
jgi:hypothetical protein